MTRQHMSLTDVMSQAAGSRSRIVFIKGGRLMIRKPHFLLTETHFSAGSYSVPDDEFSRNDFGVS